MFSPLFSLVTTQLLLTHVPVTEKTHLWVWRMMEGQAELPRNEKCLLISMTRNGGWVECKGRGKGWRRREGTGMSWCQANFSFPFWHPCTLASTCQTKYLLSRFLSLCYAKLRPPPSSSFTFSVQAWERYQFSCLTVCQKANNKILQNVKLFLIKLCWHFVHTGSKFLSALKKVQW